MADKKTLIKIKQGQQYMSAAHRRIVADYTRGEITMSQALSKMLPENASKEAREKMKAAILNEGGMTKAEKIFKGYKAGRAKVVKVAKNTNQYMKD